MNLFFLVFFEGSSVDVAPRHGGCDAAQGWIVSPGRLCYYRAASVSAGAQFFKGVLMIRDDSIHPRRMLACWSQRHLIATMVRREVASRYRGSLFGNLWALFTPLFMLAVYTLFSAWYSRLAGVVAVILAVNLPWCCLPA